MWTYTKLYSNFLKILISLSTDVKNLYIDIKNTKTDGC